MAALRNLTKQLVNFTNDNDFFPSLLEKKSQTAPPGNQNIGLGKTSCHESSRVSDAFGREDSRPHLLARRECLELRCSPSQTTARPSINLTLVAAYNLPLQKPLNLGA